jgi:hypothetical protein
VRKYPSRKSLAAEQHRRWDVLVETKEVGRVVSRLQGNEAFELALAVRRDMTADRLPQDVVG